jgi:hypothetical protein
MKIIMNTLCDNLDNNVAVSIEETLETEKD